MLAAILLTMGLLLCGMLCRLHIASFRLFYVPASVIAGTFGLTLVQLPKLLPVPNWAHLEPLAETLSGWPSTLIAVVFAALLLERQTVGSEGQLWRVSQQVIMVWIIVVGQTAVGLLTTWLLIQPLFDVPNSFGMLLETGFAGGHGTATAMGQVFAHPSIRLPEGQDLGILMATAGLLYGIASGILWINVGQRAGWIETDASIQTHLSDNAHHHNDVAQRSQQTNVPRPIGFDVLDREVIDPLLLQILWLSLAFAIGLAIQSLAVSAAGFADSFRGTVAPATPAELELDKRLTVTAVVGSFPLFIFTLFGGLTVRKLLQWCRAEHWIERATLRRLSTVAMEVLVVAAITSLNIQAVVKMIVPFSILLLAGCLWTPICLLWISRYVLPRKYWFQLGLINYGMSTGTTATGMVLLRLIDPELRSGAAQDYALAAPFSAPFIGGGMLTVAIPLIVLERIPIGVSAAVTSLAVGVMIIIGVWFGRRQHQRAMDQL